MPLAWLIQFVPYGRDHDNPEVTNTVAWDSPRTAELFDPACADCHSNETDWPWYSNVAPVSWLVQSDGEFPHELRPALEAAVHAPHRVRAPPAAA